MSFEDDNTRDSVADEMLTFHPPLGRLATWKRREGNQCEQGEFVEVAG